MAIQQGVATNGNRAGLVFKSLDGFSVAGINGVISTHSGTQSNNVGYLEFYTKSSGTASAEERMRVDSAGRLLVGTSSLLSQNAKLTVQTDGACPLQLYSTSTSGQYICFSGGGSSIVNRAFLGSAAQLIASQSETDFAVRAEGQLLFATNGANERMRIDNAGRLLVGTSSTSNTCKVQLSNGNAAAPYIETGGTNRHANGLSKLLIFRHGYWAGSQEVASIGVLTSSSNSGSGNGTGNIVFYTGSSGNGDQGSTSTERMLIDSAGRVGIGTSTTSTVNTNGFVVQPAGNGANIPFFGNGGASTNNSHISLGLYSTTAGNYRFYVGYGGTIYARSTSISALSDEREKLNIRNLDTGLAEILQLQPRRFDWRDGSGTDIPGFVAQEVEGILPELIEDYNKTETETRKALRMGDILPTLVNAIKELSAKIETLEQRLSDAGIA